MKYIVDSDCGAGQCSNEKGLVWRVAEYIWRRHVADYLISRSGITLCKRKVQYPHWVCCWELPVPTCLTFLGAQ